MEDLHSLYIEAIREVDGRSMGRIHKQIYDKKNKTGIFLGTMAAIVICSGLVPAFAQKTTEQKLKESKQTVQELQEQTSEAKEQLDAAKQKESAISDRLDKLNDQLTDVQQSLEDLDTRITQKNDQIAATEQELDEMEQKRRERYEAMKVRIRFMYENSDSSLLNSLLGAGSMSEFLNRVEYFSQVVDYDRNQLEEYQQLLTGLNEKQTNYETQKEELLALREQQNAEQEKLTTLVADARTDLKAAGAAASDASDALGDLNEQLSAEQKNQDILTAQLEYEKKLEEQKAAEDRARMEEIKRQEEELRQKREEEQRRREEEEKRRQEQAESGETAGEPSADDTSEPASAEDLELMACIIQCEAEGEPYAGKLAVGSVVMNRVASSSFPNTVMGVIYQSGQFSPVASGRMAARLAAGANSECRQAAQEVLNGNITVPYLYFRRDNGTIDGYVLGHHVFY